jgi:membrane protein involved in colicin uptake
MWIQNFAEEVANKSASEIYPDGAISVLKQFEKLQSAQKEITKCQVKHEMRRCDTINNLNCIGIKKENSLAELEKLRHEAQKFTTTALKKLDLLQATIQEKKAQEAKTLVASDGNS